MCHILLNFSVFLSEKTPPSYLYIFLFCSSILSSLDVCYEAYKIIRVSEQYEYVELTNFTEISSELFESVELKVTLKLVNFQQDLFHCSLP